MSEKDETSCYSGTDTYVLEGLFAKRIVIIDKDITEASSAELIAKIALLDIQGAKAKRPIVILINTYGGDPHCSMSIADVIENCICPTITVCIGVAISGGSILLGAGAQRFATHHASIMMHQQMIEIGSRNHTELLNETIASKVLYKQLEEYYMKVTKQPRLKIRKLLQKDSYFTAAKALEIGLIDEIGWKLHDWVK